MSTFAELDARRPNETDKVLTQRALAHANRVHNLLDANGHGAAAQRLGQEARQWGTDVTTVVVAGDIKRGKSSLVNALLGRPGFLPVDVDVATSTYLVVRHGDPQRVRVMGTDELGSSWSIEIDATEMASYASVDGTAATRHQVDAVEVEIPHDLLVGGLELVDTPGVGGMTRSHRDTTMAALGRADVLVFTVSLQEPVSRTELEFLAEASERIGNVVLVATRADLATAEETATMVEDLRDRLLTLAERTAPGGDPEPEAGSVEQRVVDATTADRLRRLARRPVVVTSSYLFEGALRREERGRHDAAAELREHSGIPELTGVLAGAVDDRQHIRLANLLQLCSGLLASLEDDLATRRRAAEGDPTVEDELRERQEQLEQATSQQARWRGTLATSIARLQTGVGRDVNRELNVVREHYRVLFESADEDMDFEALAGELQRSLAAAWSTLADRAIRRFDEVIAELLEDLGVESSTESGLLGELQAPPGLAGVGSRGSAATSAEFNMLEDGLPLATQTFLFGNIANAAVGALGIATGGLGFLAYGVGIAVSSAVVGVRRKQRSRRQQAHELQRELGEALFGQEGIAREFSSELNLRILDAREQLELLVDDRLAARRRELEERRRELHLLLKAEHSQRAAARQETERVQAELSAARQETDHLVDTVDQRLAAG